MTHSFFILHDVVHSFPLTAKVEKVVPPSFEGKLLSGVALTTIEHWLSSGPEEHDACVCALEALLKEGRATSRGSTLVLFADLVLVR